MSPLAEVTASHSSKTCLKWRCYLRPAKPNQIHEIPTRLRGLACTRFFKQVASHRPKSPSASQPLLFHCPLLYVLILKIQSSDVIYHNSLSSMPSSCLPFPFLLIVSTVFLNGHPLVLLSAPVLLLIWLPFPNIADHSPKAAKAPDTVAARRYENCDVDR
jgi:hypothetical protein